jgi:uncharacterized membrane protein YdbT with pleckstrin-like domain
MHAMTVNFEAAPELAWPYTSIVLVVLFATLGSACVGSHGVVVSTEL